jgi:hypothetical protein
MGHITTALRGVSVHEGERLHIWPCSSISCGPRSEWLGDMSLSLGCGLPRFAQVERPHKVLFLTGRNFDGLAQHTRDFQAIHCNAPINKGTMHCGATESVQSLVEVTLAYSHIYLLDATELTCYPPTATLDTASQSMPMLLSLRASGDVSS